MCWDELQIRQVYKGLLIIFSLGRYHLIDIKSELGKFRKHAMKTSTWWKLMLSKPKFSTSLSCSFLFHQIVIHICISRNDIFSIMLVEWHMWEHSELYLQDVIPSYKSLMRIQKSGSFHNSTEITMHRQNQHTWHCYANINYHDNIQTIQILRYRLYLIKINTIITRNQITTASSM